MVLGYMFRPHCGHLQANLYRLSALNVRTIWDPIVYTIMNAAETYNQETLSCSTSYSEFY